MQNFSFLDRVRKNPVVLSELRARMRGRRAFVVLAAHLFILSALILIIYAVVYQDTQSYSRYYYSGSFQRNLQAAADLGKAVFYGTVFLLLFIVSLVGPAFTSAAIAGEKERQTYDLLIITTMSARNIVLGKLNGVLGFVGLLLLATLPFFSMAYFFGGITVAQIIIATLILIATAFQFCSLGLFISSIAKSTTTANIINYAIIVPILLGVPIFIFLSGIFSIFEIIFDGNYPAIIQLFIAYVTMFFVSINPLSMAIASEAFLVETGGYFFSMESIGYSTDILVVAPWLTYLVFSTLITLLLVRLTINQLDKVSQI